MLWNRGSDRWYLSNSFWDQGKATRTKCVIYLVKQFSSNGNQHIPDSTGLYKEQPGWNEKSTEDALHRLPVGSLEEQQPQIGQDSLGIYEHLVSFWKGYIHTSASLLQFLQESLGVPWFAVIGITTIAIRVLLLPITISSMRSIAVTKFLAPQLEEINKKTIDATSRYNDEKLLELKREYLELMKKYKADPLKNFYAPFIQTPIFMSLYWGVWSLSKSNTVSLSQGGIGWFRDLTVADPHYILPLVCSTLYLITLRIAKDTMAVNSNDTALFSARLVTILSFPLTLKMPALLFCYLLPNNCFTLLLNWLLRYSSIRQRLGFPSMDGGQWKETKEDTWKHLSKAEREAMAALSYQKTSRYSSLLFAAKRGIKPRLFDRPKK